MMTMKQGDAMRRLIGIAAAAALSALVATAPLRAQGLSPDATAAAKELIEASRAADQFKMLLPLLSEQLKPAIVQGRPEIERDYDKIMPIMMDTAFRQIGKVTDDMAAIYARNFSVEEMRQVTAFYRSPTGQKLLDKLPIVLQESMALGQQFAQTLLTDMQKTLVEELRKRGHKL
jgi:hypothetical protein